MQSWRRNQSRYREPRYLLSLGKRQWGILHEHSQSDETQTTRQKIEQVLMKFSQYPNHAKMYHLSVAARHRNWVRHLIRTAQHWESWQLGVTLKLYPQDKFWGTAWCLVLQMYKHSKVGERLLRENNLTLQKTEKVRRTAGSMLAQMKVIGDTVKTTVSAVNVEH